MKLHLVNIPIIRRKFLLEGIYKLHDILSKSPLHNHFWICGGVLLGYAREGKLLKHDHDVDFHFWREDRDKFEISAELLISAGFRPEFRYRNHGGEITEHILSWRRVRFEFFEAYKTNNNTRWYSYGGSVEMLNETPGCDLEEFSFLGKKWLKPADHKAYLSALYGDWQMPNPGYSFYRDSQAVISRTPLPGITPW